MAESNTNKGKFTQNYPTERKDYVDLHKRRGRLENNGRQNTFSEKPARDNVSRTDTKTALSRRKPAA
jgi:hypothetical protein